MDLAEYSILKIYTSSTDKIGQKLVYEQLVQLAKEKGIAGATVFRGIMGYGSSSSHISTSKFWELTEKLPVVIEIIDKAEVVESFYQLIEPELVNMSKGCLVSMEPVLIKLKKPGKKK
jgi:uncharacterized protein